MKTVFWRDGLEQDFQENKEIWILYCSQNFQVLNGVNDTIYTMAQFT